jgi:hypothetical protein
MTMHHYSEADQASHLGDLLKAITSLLPELERSGRYPAERVQYERVCISAKRLLAEGFTQEALGTLSQSVPRLFWLHKEWMPPLEALGDGGGLAQPAWFKRLEPLEAKVSAAAEKLRFIGER